MNHTQINTRNSLKNAPINADLAFYKAYHNKPQHIQIYPKILQYTPHTKTVPQITKHTPKYPQHTQTWLNISQNTPNLPQHTTAYHNTPQHTKTYTNIPNHTPIYPDIPQLKTTLPNTPQHTPNLLLHAPTYLTFYCFICLVHQ